MKESEIERTESVTFADNLAGKIFTSINYKFNDDINRLTCLAYIVVNLFAVFLRFFPKDKYEEMIVQIREQALELLKNEE